MNLKQYLSKSSKKFEAFVYSKDLVYKPEKIKIVDNLPNFIRSFFSYNRGVTAITFGRFIFFFDEVTESIVVHELVHVKQYREIGFFKFLYRYVKEYYEKGYRWISFESEAYNIQYEFMGLDKK